MFNLFKDEKNYKVFDTSVLIDGRILGILQSGFIEGTIAVPTFVITELDTLGTSKWQDKRLKGQRGLEALTKIQKIIPIEILDDFDKEINDVKGVDTKLVLLCKQIKGKLLSVDNSLNDIAKVHGVSILDINELYDAIRPKIYEGQKLYIKVIRKGNEENQGVGTLEDGTMVVVDGGFPHIGKKVQVVVRSVLQNTSGRIIFTKLNTRKNE